LPLDWTVITASVYLVSALHRSNSRLACYG
jgi:hypothetical protein